MTDVANEIRQAIGETRLKGYGEPQVRDSQIVTGPHLREGLAELHKRIAMIEVNTQNLMAALIGPPHNVPAGSNEANPPKEPPALMPGLAYAIVGITRTVERIERLLERGQEALR